MFSYGKGFVFLGGEYHAHGGNEGQTPENQGFNKLQLQVTHEAFHDALARLYFPRCQGGTHATPLNDITKWINAPMDSKAPIMWLNGKPNTGSSTVAQTVADKCADAKILLASFFFSGTGDTETRSLFPTFAYQIAIKNSALRSAIGRAVENDPLIFERNLDIQMQSLIVEPLTTTSVDLSTFPLLVIIDGLDNISSHMQHTIISILAYALRKYNFPLMFLVSSIQQDSITEAFSRHLKMVEQSHTGVNSNRLSFYNLSIKPPRPSPNPIAIQTSLPADARNTDHSATRSPILLRTPTSGRIPIIDHSIRTRLKQYKRPPYRLDNAFNITCTKLLPDELTLLVGTADGTLRVWETAHGHLKTEYRFSGMVIDIAYSSSSYLKYAVVSQDTKTPTTSIWAVLNDKKSTKVKVEDELPPLSHVYALSNGTIVAPYYIQGRVYLKSWKMRKHGTSGVSWDKGVTLSDLASLRNHDGSPDTFSGCAFSVSSDQKTFWTATKSGSVFSSKLENGHQVTEALQLPSHNPRSASISSAQSYSGYPNIPRASTSSHQTSYNLGPPQANLEPRPATIIPIYSSNSVPAHYAISPSPNFGPQVCLACSPDQRRLAVSLASGEIYLWDISLRVAKTMREAKVTIPPAQGASPVTFSTDSKYIVYACNDLERSIKIQDIATSTISDSVLLEECPENDEITFISVTKDFKHIIVSFRQCSYSLLFKWP